MAKASMDDGSSVVTAPSEDTVETKSIFSSKTFWLNVLGPVFAWFATSKGINLSPDEQVEVITAVMALANIVMRFLSVQPVHLVPPSAPQPLPLSVSDIRLVAEAVFSERIRELSTPKA